MDLLAPDIRQFQRLDRLPVPRYWEAALHYSLSNIFHFLPSEDQKLLANFRAYMGELGPHDGSDYFNPKIPTGAHVHHPISVTLLTLNNAERSDTLLRLSAIMVCAALDPANSVGNSRKKLTKFAERIRGIIVDPNSPIKLRLAEARSIPQLAQIMELDLAHSEIGIRDDFGRLWTSWLGDVINRWMRDDAANLRLGLESTFLLPALDAPVLPVLAGDLIDSDDATEISSYIVDETPADVEEPSARARYSRAKIGLMIRTSDGDLLANPSQELPDSMIVRITAGSINTAESALRRKSLYEAEQFVALAVMIATGIREIELSDLVWEDKGSE